MIPLIVAIVIGVIIYIFRLAIKESVAKEKEAEKLVNALYEVAKLDENETTFQCGDKKLKLTKEENRIINIAILFAGVFVAFERKVPNIQTIKIMQWFSFLTKEKGFLDGELFAVRNYLFEPRSTEKRIAYLEFSKELKKITGLVVDNFQESMNSKYASNELQLLAINAFVGDRNIVLGEFLTRKDFPKLFSDLDYNPLKQKGL